MSRDVCKRFGQRVRVLREAHGISQENFARVVGIDRTYQSGIERGVRNPTLIIIARLAGALEVRIADLFDE